MYCKSAFVGYLFLASPAFSFENGGSDALLVAGRQLCQGTPTDSDAKLAKFCVAVEREEKRKTWSLVPVPSMNAAAGNETLVSGNHITSPPTPNKRTELINSVRTERLLRKDPSQSFEGLEPRGTKDSAGAKIDIGQDYLKDSQSYSGQGFGSYTLSWPTYDLSNTETADLIAVGFGPWIYATGSLKQPVNKDLSAVEAGIQGQIEIARAFEAFLPSTFLFVGATPYYQTDLAGTAQIYGFRTQLAPTNFNWNIGARTDDEDRKVITHVIALMGEVDYKHVDDPGYTNYETETDYLWLGGKAEVRLTFFQNMKDVVPDWLNNRLYAIGSVQVFRDAYSSQIASQYEAEFGYKLQGGKDAQSNREGPQTTIALTYSHGEDKEILKEVDQAKLSLTFKQ